MLLQEPPESVKINSLLLIIDPIFNIGHNITHIFFSVQVVDPHTNSSMQTSGTYIVGAPRPNLIHCLDEVVAIGIEAKTINITIILKRSWLLVHEMPF